MKFLPCLDLHLTHSYYTDGRCPDFWLEPTLATQRLLANYRCLLKPVPDGVRIFVAVTEAGVPFIPFPPDMIFAFRLYLQNPDFVLFTDLTEIGQTRLPLYTNGEARPGKPGPLGLVSPRIWATERFAVRQPAQEDRFVLSGRPLAGLQLTDFTIEGLGVITQPTYYEANTKVITVNSKTARKDDIFKLTYATVPLREKNVFAAIEIHYSPPFPEVTAGPPEFHVTFKAKKARWIYYVLADMSAAQFFIKDRGASPVGFSDKNRTDLNQQPDPTDKVAQMLAEQYPKLRRLRFVSDDLVPCQQEARKAIQLYMDSTPVIETLPNPSLQNYAPIEMSGSGNGNSLPEDTLFQVIKYFTYQFQATGGS